MRRFFKKYVPITFIVALVLFVSSYILLGAASRDYTVADGISGGIGRSLRAALAYITNPLPISVAELLVITLILCAIMLVFLCILAVKSWRTRVRILFHILSFIFVMYSWYAIAFGASYHTEPIERKMGFAVTGVDEDDLYELSLYLVGELNDLAKAVANPLGESKMGYDMRTLSERAVSAYDAFVADYPIFENFTSYVKPVMLSRLMAYTGILGMYTYFSGEANISTVYPDYCIPASVIHEFAHQRGVAREDEANFISYAVCSYSDDSYIRYSGFLNLFEYTVSALSATNRELVGELYSMLDAGVISDMRAYSDFYNAHKITFIRNISNFFNDTYLRLNGTEGVVSYSRVVRLSVSYYKSLGIISQDN